MPSVRKTQKKLGGFNSPKPSSSSVKSPQLNSKITKCSDLAKFSFLPIRQECMKKCHDPYKTTILTNNNKTKFKNPLDKYATCVKCLYNKSQNDICKNLLDHDNPDTIEKKRRQNILSRSDIHNITKDALKKKYEEFNKLKKKGSSKFNNTNKRNYKSLPILIKRLEKTSEKAKNTENDTMTIEKKRRQNILDILEPTHQFRIDLTNLYARLDELNKSPNSKEKTFKYKNLSEKIKILEDQINFLKPKILQN